MKYRDRSSHINLSDPNINTTIHGPCLCVRDDQNDEDTRTLALSSYTTQLRVRNYSSVPAQHKNCPSSAFDDRPGRDLFKAGVTDVVPAGTRSPAGIGGARGRHSPQDF